MSLALYESALLDVASARPTAVHMRIDDGDIHALDVRRWSGVPDNADQQLLARLSGPVLDIGCGPGRFGASLAARGIPALGLDLSGVAVAMARARGGHALQGDVFGDVPDEGGWHDVLLIDGNVGIGGNPTRLLTRAAQLLTEDGIVHVEIEPPGGRDGSSRIRLEEAAGHVGAWFPWGWLSVHQVTRVAADAGLFVQERWHCDDRWFAELHR